MTRIARSALAWSYRLVRNRELNERIGKLTFGFAAGWLIAELLRALFAGVCR